MERGARGELDGQRVLGEPGRMSLAQHRCCGDRAFLDGRKDRAQPGFLQLFELERRRRRHRHGLDRGLLRTPLGVGHRDWCARDVAPRLELLEPVGKGLARQVATGAGDLHERELQRQARVAALSHVLDGHGQEVDQTDHGRFAELIRLRAEPLAGLLGDGQRIRHLAHVLHEHQMTQMLEQVDDQAAEILSLLRELLHERESAGGVSVDDEVAEPEEGLLLHGAEQLEHRLHRDVLLRRRCELVERRHRVAERPACTARDEREGLIRDLDLLAIRHAAKQADELGETRAREHERLAA